MTRSIPRAVVAAVVLAAAALPVAPAAASDHGPDHVVVTGGVTVPRGETVHDVIVVDGPVRIAGHATGDVVAVAGRVDVTGRIDGDLTTVSDRATLGRTASVGGDLLYGDERPVIHSAARVDGDVSDEGWSDLSSPIALNLVSIAWWIAVSLSTVALGLLFVWLAPRSAEAVARTARERLGEVVAWGATLFVLVPVLAVMAVFTLVGIPLGLAVLFALVPLGGLAYVTAAWVLGRSVRRTGDPMVSFLAGWGILRAIALIPVLGLAVSVAAVIVGIGALAATLWALRTRAGETPAPGAAAPAG